MRKPQGKPSMGLLTDYEVRLSIYRMLIETEAAVQRCAKRTIALSHLLVRKNLTTWEEIDTFEKEFAALVAVETALDPKLVERIKRARAKELRPQSSRNTKRRRKV